MGSSLLAAACGSSPSAPTSADVPVKGAVVRGTVAGVSGASLGVVRATSVSGLRVSVVGTSIAATTDAAGRFVLSGLPSGTVILRFEGPGVDAQVQVSGLADGQVLTITVRVNGHEAELEDDDSPKASPSPSPSPSASPRPSPSPDDEDDDEAEVEFKGTVDSVAPPNLVVSGKTVRTDGNTRIVRKDQRIALSDVKAGNKVEVDGVRQADGSVLAKKIKVEDGHDGEDDDE